MGGSGGITSQKWFLPVIGVLVAVVTVFFLWCCCCYSSSLMLLWCALKPTQKRTDPNLRTQQKKKLEIRAATRLSSSSCGVHIVKKKKKKKTKRIQRVSPN